MTFRLHLVLAGAMGAIGSMLASSTANAVILGLSVAEVGAPPGPPPPGGPRRIFHVFAEFTNPSDRVNTWGGGGNLGAINGIWNVLEDGVTLGAGFTNIVPGGPPPVPGTESDWDTFMTIGTLYQYESPGGLSPLILLPGTPPFCTTNPFMFPVSGGGITLTPADPQGRADYRVEGPDTELNVLLMQLVVNAGEHVKGTIGVNWQSVGGLATNSPGLTFNSIPAPGSLGLLALAGVLRASRRRRR